MIHQPPAGARDLLPLEVAQKCWINDTLLQVFQRWGYQRLVTSTLERVETLIAGGAIEPATVIQLQDIGEGILGLRSELTASIARTAVTRMASEFTERLCYRANVFRQPRAGHHGQQLEFYQAGVELLKAGGILPDAEILLLVSECLQQLGLQQWQILLGEASLTRSLLSWFPQDLQPSIRRCLAQLDYIGLANLPMSSDLRSRALYLFDLRGKPTEVLQKVSQLELDSEAQEIVNNLKSLIELLNKTSVEPLPLILDLSLVQTIDYYTGIVFQVVSHNNQWRQLGQGGRYDQLLGMYQTTGQSAPGIGFALNIEDLHACLVATKGIPQPNLGSDWLVVPETRENQTEAFIYAQKLRTSEHLVKVEIELSGKNSEAIREYATQKGIKRVAWVQADGSVKIENI